MGDTFEITQHPEDIASNKLNWQQRAAKVKMQMRIGQKFGVLQRV